MLHLGEQLEALLELGRLRIAGDPLRVEPGGGRARLQPRPQLRGARGEDDDELHALAWWRLGLRVRA